MSVFNIFARKDINKGVRNFSKNENAFLFAVALQKVLTAYYALTVLQSLRHGFAVPPPFAQGRLYCESARQILIDRLDYIPFLCINQGGSIVYLMKS